MHLGIPERRQSLGMRCFIGELARDTGRINERRDGMAHVLAPARHLKRLTV